MHASPTRRSSDLCSVANGTGTVAGANVSSVTVSCATNTFTVGGTISGLSGTVVLQNNGGDNLTISVNGAFTFAAALTNASPYAVTVLAQPAGQTCTVANDAGTVSGANVTNVTLTCSAIAFSVGGTVSGLSGSVVLQNNGGDELSISANGTFTFGTPIASGTAYSVTVLTQPTNPSQSCTVTNGSGTVAGANITNIAVTCVTNTFTIGGTVGGLSGTGLVLRNNGGDNLTVLANGAFTFSTAIASGSPYAVTVLTQPTNPSQ